MLINIIVIAFFILNCVMLVQNRLHKSIGKRKKTNGKNKFTVYISESYAIFGMTVATIILFFHTVFPLLIWEEKPGIIFYMVAGSVTLSQLYVAFKALRFSVFVENDTISVNPAFSRPYTFTFDDIVSVKRQTKGMRESIRERVVIRTKNNRKLIVEDSFISYKRFTDELLKKVDSSIITGF